MVKNFCCISNEHNLTWLRTITHPSNNSLCVIVREYPSVNLVRISWLNSISTLNTYFVKLNGSWTWSNCLDSENTDLGKVHFLANFLAICWLVLHIPKPSFVKSGVEPYISWSLFLYHDWYENTGNLLIFCQSQHLLTGQAKEFWSFFLDLRGQFRELTNKILILRQIDSGNSKTWQHILTQLFREEQRPRSSFRSVLEEYSS